jgi:hypothetical protein
LESDQSRRGPFGEGDRNCGAILRVRDSNLEVKESDHSKELFKWRPKKVREAFWSEEAAFIKKGSTIWREASTSSDASRRVD